MDDIEDALEDIDAPVGGEFVLVDMSTTIVINQRDTAKINFGTIRPPADDLESLATACAEAVAEMYTGKYNSRVFLTRVGSRVYIVLSQSLHFPES